MQGDEQILAQGFNCTNRQLRKKMKKFILYGRCSLTTKIRYPTNATANIDKNKLIKHGKTSVDLVSRYCDNCRGFHIWSIYE